MTVPTNEVLMPEFLDLNPFDKEAGGGRMIEGFVCRI
jgi:hypothetical protein